MTSERLIEERLSVLEARLSERITALESVSLEQTLTVLLGVNPRDLRAAIIWLYEEHRKARR